MEPRPLEHYFLLSFSHRTGIACRFFGGMIVDRSRSLSFSPLCSLSSSTNSFFTHSFPHALVSERDGPKFTEFSATPTLDLPCLRASIATFYFSPSINLPSTFSLEFTHPTLVNNIFCSLSLSALSSVLADFFLLSPPPPRLALLSSAERSLSFLASLVRPQRSPPLPLPPSPLPAHFSPFPVLPSRATGRRTGTQPLSSLLLAPRSPLAFLSCVPPLPPLPPFILLSRCLSSYFPKLPASPSHRHLFVFLALHLPRNSLLPVSLSMDQVKQLVVATLDVTYTATALAVESLGSPSREKPTPLTRNTTFDLSLAEDGHWDAHASDSHFAHTGSRRQKFEQAVATLKERATDVSAIGEEGISEFFSPTPPLLPVSAKVRRSDSLHNMEVPQVRVV